MIKIYTDAATKGNPGPSAAGVLLVVDGEQRQLKHFLGTLSNHEAEFAATLFAFQQLPKYARPNETIFFFTDSKIVDQSLATNYAKHFQNYVDQINTIQDQFPLVVSQWIPERMNQGAHNLALQALHAQI
ncbi:ribonuclease HI family protein [Periweissella fabaria]|uniref:14.7 kDa ribonuclease H-like protein n=1 Tax=Periweissella fabaria TaxID=546157 RepID=A0ABN8BHD7_9LACO|nr:ribonuclease HI family protein [Periweissella fabaria]MCM0596508.1 ribonuclease HI family protein [Periweissella fabaria]CAH0415763.1 14.7 kDa ribonuclease H-like protein [Periweissella fabaria]